MTLYKFKPLHIQKHKTINEVNSIGSVSDLWSGGHGFDTRLRRHSCGRCFPLPLTSDLCEKVVSGFERMLCKYWCGKARKTWVGALTTVIWPKLLKAALNSKQTNKQTKLTQNELEITLREMNIPGRRPDTVIAVLLKDYNSRQK